jgi:hypothetical protein
LPARLRDLHACNVGLSTAGDHALAHGYEATREDRDGCLR